MPAPVIGGLTSFLQTQLTEVVGSQIFVWDGEIPRTTPAGSPILLPAVPALRGCMTKAGLRREWNMGSDPYVDRGPIYIQVWDTTRAATETLLGEIDAIFASQSNVTNIQLPGGPGVNPYYVIDLLLDTWTCINEETIRDQNSNLLYLGEMLYNIEVHGAIQTS